MELRTYTRLWNVEKRIYKIYDFTLPMPVPVKTLAVVVLVGGPWIGLMVALGVPFHPPWQLVYVFPPALIAWRMNKPVAEGKRIVQFASSQIRYLLQARHFVRFAAWRGPQQISVRGEIWHRGQVERQPDEPEQSTFLAA